MAKDKTIYKCLCGFHEQLMYTTNGWITVYGLSTDCTGEHENLSAIACPKCGTIRLIGWRYVS